MDEEPRPSGAATAVRAEPVEPPQPPRGREPTVQQRIDRLKQQIALVRSKSREFPC